MKEMRIRKTRLQLGIYRLANQNYRKKITVEKAKPSFSVINMLLVIRKLDIILMMMYLAKMIFCLS